jgi:hypothetical protein
VGFRPLTVCAAVSETRAAFPHPTTRATDEDEWLWGWDPTPGIVSVWAEADGRAVVWRRIPESGELVRDDARDRPWLLLDRLDDLMDGESEMAHDDEIRLRSVRPGTPGRSAHRCPPGRCDRRQARGGPPRPCGGGERS